MKFTQQAYQGEKPFANFLSGIAGEKGIPLWVFYVNRGQLISSFGTRDKNGAIMEFFPADQAFTHVAQIGFRTFIKVDDQVIECFQECNKHHQTLIEEPHSVTIEEWIPSFHFSIEVTYFTLPQEQIGGLVRKVKIKNKGNSPQKITIVDGLAKMFPANLDSGLLKNMSNTLRSWMRTNQQHDAVLYSLSASLGDTAQVNLIEDVHTYQTFGLQDKTYITDLRALFQQDTTLRTPYGLFEDTSLMKQAHVNQIPAAMTLTSCELVQELNFYSLFSYSQSRDAYFEKASSFTEDYFDKKLQENAALHQSLMASVETSTIHTMFNDYLQKTYLDNILRGGTPKMIETRQGVIPYYIYSRKHGDLERDYNFFSIEANYLSQGNGNFRDVLQNRRNDLLFEPRIKAFNLYQFLSFIQADGYNPLSIQGIKFNYKGPVCQDEKLDNWLKQPYSPGNLWMFLIAHHQEHLMHAILRDSDMEYVAHFHEGYWEDHFTYIYDLIELYENIYPDTMTEMLFQHFIAYYQSPAGVMPRAEKYVQTKEGKIRQYGSIKHMQQDHHWLTDKNNQSLKTNVCGKLLTLVITKFGHLDPESMGLMYEADRPGWNDAMNGLPGLFGSGVSEMFELAKLVQFLHVQLERNPQQSVPVLQPLFTLMKAYTDKDTARTFDKRMTALEAYRAELFAPQEQVVLRASDCLESILQITEVLTEAISKIKRQYAVPPTYLTYDAQSYTLIGTGQPHITHYGLPAVKVHTFSQQTLPLFLEGPARFLKTFATPEEANTLYRSIQASPLYDSQLKMYKTSEPIGHLTHEIGRIQAFTPGWLERESIFLHMTYKYLLGLLAAGAYEAFYEALDTNLICFLDPHIYGRSTLENSSFLASSNNPDPSLHGQGFVARLSGSTAELLSMWRLMFFGKKLFTWDGELSFQLSPKLAYTWFKNDIIQTKLFSSVQVTYVNVAQTHTFADNVGVVSYEFRKSGKSMGIVHDHRVKGTFALDIRNQHIDEVIVHLDYTAK